GNRLDLSIVIDLDPSGTYTRTTTQHLQLVSGDSKLERVDAAYDASGKQTSELLEATTKQGALTQTERTETAFAAGVAVRRETDITQSQSQTDPETKEQSSIEVRVNGIWEEGGAPLKDTTIPQ